MKYESRVVKSNSDFCVTIPRYYKDVNVKVFFARSARHKISAYRMLAFEFWFEWLKLQN